LLTHSRGNYPVWGIESICEHCS